MDVPAGHDELPDDALPDHVVPIEGEGRRLVDHLRIHLGVVARRAIGPLIADGHVTVNGLPARIADPVAAGQVIALAPRAMAVLVRDGHTTPPSDAPLAIAFEDDVLVVVDKPAGMHVHPMGAHREATLLGALLWHAGARAASPWTAWRPYPAHRLDRATSGLIAFAKDDATQDAFRQLLDTGAVARTYLATVEGDVPGDAGTIDAPLGRDPLDDYRRAEVAVAEGGKPAVTHWRVIARGDRDGVPFTSLEVTLETGRTHQIRAHFAGRGHPIVGDTLYGAAPDAGNDDTDPVTPKIALRAIRLAFPHPTTGVPIDLADEASAT